MMKVRSLIGRSADQQTPLDEAEELTRARRRVAGMSTHALLEWADTAGSGMAKGFGDYRKEGRLESLDEIRYALLALIAVTDELQARQEAEKR